MDRLFVGLGAFAAFIAVALGAFAAHALKSRLTADALALFEIGVRYQLYHALVARHEEAREFGPAARQLSAGGRGGLRLASATRRL